MATGIWMAIIVMIFFYLVYLFKRFVLGKSKEQIRLEELEKKEIDIMTSNSIFKSKSKKEKQLADVKNEIKSLNNKIKQNKYETISRNVSLTKAVINHSKDIASEIKPAINEYKEKHSFLKTTLEETPTSVPNNVNINEDEIYEQIMIEIEEDRKVKSTWAKALAQSDGDRDKAESLYIKTRVYNIKNLKKSYLDNQLKLEEKDSKLLKEEKSSFDIAKEEYLNQYIKRNEIDRKINDHESEKKLTIFLKNEKLIIIDRINDSEVIAKKPSNPLLLKLMYTNSDWYIDEIIAN